MADKTDILYQLCDQKKIERDIREHNPIVKEAWEHYQEVLAIYMRAEGYQPREAVNS